MSTRERLHHRGAEDGAAKRGGLSMTRNFTRQSPRTKPRVIELTEVGLIAALLVIAAALILAIALTVRQ